MKFNFEKIEEKEIFFADENYAKLNFKDYTSYIFSGNKINLYYFFSTLIEYFFSKKKITIREAYLITIVKKVNPKIVIDHELYRRGFKIKKLFPQIKLIVYQYGHYFPNGYHGMRSLIEDKKCDYFFVFNKLITKELRKMKTKKFIIGGSIKNNNRIKKDVKKIYDLMFISEFRELDKHYMEKNKSFFNKEDFNKLNFNNAWSVVILNALSNFCTKYKKKLAIGRSSQRKDKANKISTEDENTFHEINAPNYYAENVDTESLAEKSKLIICKTSNLGPELLIKGHKVLFLNCNYQIYNWAFKKKDLSGPFWYKGSDEKIIFKKIKYLLSISNKRYRSLVKKNFDLITYDLGNKKLLQVIKNILEK